MKRVEVPFSSLIGKTLVSIRGAEAGSDEVFLVAASGEDYRMYHAQDCCESVYINDIEGDIADLIGSPVVVAEESTNNDPIAGVDPSDSFTWTFYRLATAKGWVVIRWLGESNGYYSESVDFDVPTADYEVCQDGARWRVLHPTGVVQWFENEAAALAYRELALANK